MAVELNDEDLEFLLDLVDNLDELRDSSGLGNNIANPEWGAADQPFIRLTTPFFADGVSAPRETELTPREISDILVNQDTDGDGVEESIPNLFGNNAFLTFFGQYFDHGLDFVSKGEPGTLPIGVMTMPDSTEVPLSGPRANIIPGTGVDPDGTPDNGDEVPAQHVNKVSPFVDQNQAYGSNDAVTDLLRRWELDDDGSPVKSAYLLGGQQLDETGRALLPTLNDIRENYRIMTDGDELTSDDISNYQGSGHALLIDFIPAFSSPGVLDLDAMGHYFVAGDGRANENVMLTSIHTIWARNHNFWVDELKEKTGGEWTEEQYFQAARVVNIAEYQRVVFTEFADAMAGGLSGSGTHGFAGYDPSIDPSISAEFAHVAYRFGHSMLNETVSFVDDATGELAEVSLVEAFLSPQNVAELGVANLIQGATAVEHQAIDVHMVNALRNQLVGRPLDLAALNIFRGRDTGVAPFNEVRAELFAKTGDNDLRPYEGWDDFQDRNDIPGALMAKLKAAYPEGFEALDLWVGGLLERPREGQLGDTFAWIFLDQLDRLQEGDRFYYLHQLDDADFRDQINDQTFSEIIARNTGLTDLPANIFEATPLAAPTPDEGTPAEPPAVLPETVPTEAAESIDGTPDDDTIDGLGGNDEIYGNEGDDTIAGGEGHDELYGGEGDDTLHGGPGNDSLDGGEGDDALHGGEGNDELYGGEGDDALQGAGGHDELYGGEGDDALHGGAGSDYLDGGDGDDSLEGGEGDDELDGGDGDDIAVFSGARVNYDVTTHTDGTTTVTHLNGGADGTDILENIEQLQFSDESIMTPPASAGGNPPENTAPSATSIGNQTAHPGAHFSMSAASHFTDSDPDDTLTYSIDGPSWLSIDAETGMISGTPPTHAVLEQLTSDANGGYALPASGTVHISAEFFSGSAGYNSSYGYYLADASGEPIGGAVIENNVKTLGSKGVTLDLDDFPGAATLGFFIIPDGARKNPSLTDGQPVEFQFDCGSWSAYADDVKLNGQGASIYFSDKALNSDDYDHLKDNGHNGNQNWEDLRGGGDKDFDDTNVEVSVVSEQMASDAIDGPVTVTATDSHGMTAQVSFQLAVAPAMAAMSANAAFAHAGQVQIEDETPDDGTVNAAENQPLSANLQLLVNADGISEIKYQWQYSADGQSWSPVPGATNSRFTPRQSEAGLSLRVALTFIFIDSALESQTAYSAPTAPVMRASSADSAQGQNGQTVNAVPENSANDTENGNEDQVDENGEHAWRENEDIDFADLNLIHGSDGINFLRGTRQNDLIKAENGNDLVMAGRGDDVIIGGDGNDKLFGGKGNDTIYGGAGDDRIHGGEGDDVLYGEAGDDKLYGGEGDDQLDGGDGSDTLEGGKGDDILLGGAGNDTLLGGAGDDIIVGGEGDDILYGGAGRDTFVYGYNHGNNQIMDFEEDLDEIQLEQDAPTYSIVYTENGWEYLFDSGTTLVVHSNKGKGRNDDDYDDDLSFSVLAASTIGLGEETDDYGNEEWAELVAAGVIDLGNESVPAHGTEAGSDWLNDVDAPSLLSVSTILFSHEDGNLFG